MRAVSLSPRARSSLRWVFAALTAAGIVLHIVAVYDLLVLLAASVHWDPSVPETFGAMVWRHAKIPTLDFPFLALGWCFALVGVACWLRLRRPWIGALLVVAGLTASSLYHLQGSMSQLLTGGAPFLWLRNEWQNFSNTVVSHEYWPFVYTYAPRLLLIPWLIVLVHDATRPRRREPQD